MLTTRLIIRLRMCVSQLDFIVATLLRSQILAITLARTNVIITDKSDGQNYKNKHLIWYKMEFSFNKTYIIYTGSLQGKKASYVISVKNQGLVFKYIRFNTKILLKPFTVQLKINVNFKDVVH